MYMIVNRWCYTTRWAPPGTMSFLVWNCCGAGKPATVRELRDTSKQFFPTFICILETQIDATRVESMTPFLGFSNSYAVSSTGRTGGLGVFWNNSIKVEIIGHSQYHIDTIVGESDAEQWRQTFDY